MAFTRRDMIRTGAMGGGALLAGVFLSHVTRAAAPVEIKHREAATKEDHRQSVEFVETAKRTD